MSPKTTKAASSSIKPVYVISGETGRARDEKLSQLRQQVLAGCDWSTCLREFDADQADIAEVLDELRTLPFLGSRRMVEIRGADDFAKEHRQLLEEYLASPSPTGALVLVLDKPLPGNLRLAKIINKIGQSHSLEPAKKQDLAYLLVNLAKEKYAKVLAPATARALQELAGDSLSRLTEELEKLSLYVGDQKKITVEDVEALVGQNRQLSVFEMIDALIGQDTAQAMRLLETLLEQDRSAEYTIISLLAWYVRRLRKAQSLLANGVSEGQICSQLRVWYRRDEFIRQVKQSSTESLRLTCKRLAEADRTVKRGLSSVRNAVEKFIYSLTNQSARV